MDRVRRALGTSLAGTLPALASLTLGLLGCPQLLRDGFITAPPAETGGGVSEVPLPGIDGQPRHEQPGVTDAGNANVAVPMVDSGVQRSPPPPPPPPQLPDGGGSAAKTPDSGPPACVPNTELCDGLDNDCDGAVDEAPACTSDCTGFLLEGRAAMFCGGAGATFANAEARCVAQGMRPVVIDSAEKSAAVLQAVDPLYAGLSTISETQHAIWIDAHDGEVEGTWHWGTNGTVFWIGDATGSVQNGAYVDWAPGKPNNAGGGDGEDCAVMHVGSGADPLGSWNDDTCDGVHTFLCEAPEP